MTAYLLIGPPASGKTHLCIRTIQEYQEQKSLASIWVIVRDRLQAAYFRRRLAEAGEGLGVHVETFRDLHREILERSGNPVRPFVNPTLSFQVMRTAVKNAKLEYFSPLRDLPGFSSTILQRVSELQRALVNPEQFACVGNSSIRSFGEIAQIYKSYQETLDAIGWDDLGTMARRALNALVMDPGLFADLDLLIFDGFDWFDPAQRHAIQRLEGRVKRLIVTLPGRPGLNRAVERGFSKAHRELCDNVSFEKISIDTGPHLPPALAAVEVNLLASSPSPFKDDASAIELIEARSPVEEAREALRWMKIRLVRDPQPPTHCAILVPDSDTYAPFLRAAASELGLPIHFAQQQPLSRAPAVQALLNLLSLPVTHYPRRGLLDSLRSPFFNLSNLRLTPAQVDVLDLVSRYGKVIEGLHQWEEVFTALSGLAEEPISIENTEREDGPGLPVLPRGESVHQLREAFAGFAVRITPPDGGYSIAEWIAWLEKLLDSLGFYPKRSTEIAREERAVLESLRDCLQGLLAAEAVFAPIGHPTLDYAAFLSDLQAALESTQYTDELPSQSMHIQVLRILEARGLRFDIVAVLGLSEGGFPRAERTDPLLTEETRLQLGAQLRLEQDQLGSFYQAVTRADQALLLTRPYLSDSGDPWEPSPYWNAVRTLFPNRVRRIRPDAPLPLSDAASSGEALFWAVRRQAAIHQDLPGGKLQELAGRLVEIRRSQSRLAALLNPEQSNGADSPDGLAELVSAQYGPNRAWSVSRLEAFAACPFRFFVENILAVEAHETPEWDLDAAQLGSLLHEILEKTYQGAKSTSDTVELLGRLEEVAQIAIRKAPAKYGFRPSPLWEEAQGELMERLRETVLGLAELGGDWEPIAFEQPFGFGKAPALEIDVEGRQIRLHGFIDRIDRNPQGKIRVIDYKTGGSHLGKGDLVEGRRLQLAVYALAAWKALDLGEPAEGFYWKIGKDGQKASLRLSRFAADGRSGPRGAMEIAEEHIHRLVRRISGGDFSSDPLDGKCAPYCAAAPWCWFYDPERQA